MSATSLRAAVGAAAVGTMLVMGSGMAQAAPAVGIDPAPAAVVQQQLPTQPAGLSVGIGIVLGPLAPLAPFIAGIICLPANIATPVAWAICTV